MKLRYILPLSIALTACSAHIPDSSQPQGGYPSIFPDYTDVTIPSNIAPLNFRILEEGSKYVTVMTAGSERFVTSGDNVTIPASRWQKLKSTDNIDIQVYVYSNGRWNSYNPFTFRVSDDIDPFISYRVIMPSIESYERLSINQRDITSFKEKVIYSNQMVQDADKGQCINCHHYRNYTTSNMQFHARQYLGGTVLVIDNKLNKVNLKTDSTISAGVYPAWHPTHDYIAYSTNKTHQSIRSKNHNRIEVADEESDLILYDIRNNAVSVIENDSNQFECYPAWSPDGRMLYYVSAHYESPFDAKRRDQVFINSSEIRYDLYCKPFDPDTRTWGPSRLLYECSKDGMSATLPRVSPDGKQLMFSMAPYGVFHIWHRESDLWMMDLRDETIRRLDEINSPEVESYHSWSSNGKWIIFSTRREDGAYTRLYLAHLENDGTFSKPFALPQRDPDFNNSFLFSFNIPEFMKEPVRISAREFASFISGTQAVPAKYQPKREE